MKNMCIGILLLFMTSCSLNLQEANIPVSEKTGSAQIEIDSHSKVIQMDTFSGSTRNVGIVQSASGVKATGAISAHFPDTSLINGTIPTNMIKDAITLDEFCKLDTNTTNNDAYHNPSIEFKFMRDTNGMTKNPFRQKEILYFVADLGFYEDFHDKSYSQTGYLVSYNCKNGTSSQISQKNIREIFKGSRVDVQYISPNIILLVHYAYEGNKSTYALLDRKTDTMRIIDFSKMSGYPKMLASIKKANNEEHEGKWDLVARSITMNSDTEGTVIFSFDRGYNCLKIQEIYSVDFAKSSIVKKLGTRENHVCETY